MHLLNTQTLRLSEFFEADTPKYIILSHTWDGSEITLQDWEAGTKTDGPGHAKVLKFSQYAAKNNHEWCWVDTICIDKQSSADLSEAINSMFAWYAEAEICVVYLSDVAIGRRRKTTLRNFEASRWFTRGWTLQELLAPEQAIFLDQNWKFIGDKAELIESLVAATTIPAYFLLNNVTLNLASVAERMSWASRRRTTRIEDRAYCLMGIFGTNMPLLYGERHKAFRRLQEEIIKVSEDESILVWNESEVYYLGCLAPDPSCFRTCGNILERRIWHQNDLQTSSGPAYSLIKKQLELNACIPNAPESWAATGHFSPLDQQTIEVALNCYQSDDPEDSYCLLTLRYSYWERRWQRVQNESSRPKSMRIPRDLKEKMFHMRISVLAYR